MTITKVVARLNVKFRHGVMELNSMACLPSPNSDIAIMTTNKPKNHNKIRTWPLRNGPAADDHHHHYEQTANIPSKAQLKEIEKEKRKKKKLDVDIYPFQGSGREFELVIRFVVGPIPT
jgi:hypothetical protein